MADGQDGQTKSGGAVDVEEVRRHLKWALTERAATRELRRKSIKRCLEDHIPALLARVKELERRASRAEAFFVCVTDAITNPWFANRRIAQIERILDDYKRETVAQ